MPAAASPRKTWKRIFQPFFTKKAKGTGLGLALVKKVIDMHHGEVEASSARGQGL
ncbi:MAG: ATP-binding protein [Desulfobacterales bacterium]|nr:ATP-binding protein [Desulfobacterales bacterium]